VSRPSWPGRKDSVPAKPEVHDRPPDPFAGVPRERDPATGKVLPGAAAGRSDKGRSAAPRRLAKLPILVGAAVALIALGTVVVVTQAGPGDAVAVTTQSGAPEEPGAGGDAATGGAEPFLDPVEVIMRMTAVDIITPPGPPPDVGIEPGESVRHLWTFTGPCDGEGDCRMQGPCPGYCNFDIVGTPTGSGYTGSYDYLFQGDPECGTVTVALELTVSRTARSVKAEGTWVETPPAQFGQVLRDGDRSTFCGGVVWVLDLATV